MAFVGYGTPGSIPPSAGNQLNFEESQGSFGQAGELLFRLNLVVCSQSLISKTGASGPSCGGEIGGEAAVRIERCHEGLNLALSSPFSRVGPSESIRLIRARTAL
jgi:hypothetical protein